MVLNFTSACILHNIHEELKEHYLEDLNRLDKDEIGDLLRSDRLNTIIRNLNVSAKYLCS